MYIKDSRGQTRLEHSLKLTFEFLSSGFIDQNNAFIIHNQKFIFIKIKKHHSLNFKTISLMSQN